MKICYLCNEYPPYSPGGIGITVQQLARFMANRGHEVHVAGVYPGSKKLIRNEDAGVKVWRLPWNTSVRRSKIQDLISRLHLRRHILYLIKAYGLDLLEGPDYRGSLVFMPSSVIRICRIHNSLVFAKLQTGNRLSWYDRIERGSKLFSDYFVAVSDYVYRVFHEFNRPFRKRPIEIIPNPINGDFFKIRANFRDNHIIVYSGSLNENKGVPTLLEAWCKIKDQWPQYSLSLFGKAGSSLQLVEQLSDNPKNRIKWFGAVSHEELAQAYKQAYCAVFPSHHESCALAPNEAAAAGVPVIVTRNDGFSKIFTEGKDAIMCNPGDSGGLTKAMNFLLSNPEEALKISCSGKGSRKKYHSEVIGLVNENYYEKVLNGDMK